MKCNQCGADFDSKFCPNCGTPADDSQQVQPEVSNGYEAQPMAQFGQPVVHQPSQNPSKPFYKKWWFWAIAIVVVIGILGSLGGNDHNTNNGTGNGASEATENGNASRNDSNVNKKAKVTVVDFSKMDQDAILIWADTNKVTCNFSKDYSDTVAKGSVISQSKPAGATVQEGDILKVVISLGKKPPIEYTNALKKAESYSKTMHMSKKGIYNQLTSEYGEKFSADAAQYAIDNMTADWNENALQKAKSYQKTMNMSKSKIYDQLISEYGEKFTKEEAQYAIDHLED